MRRILLAVGDTATSLQTARHIRPWLRERDTSLTLLSVVAPEALSPLSSRTHVLEQTEAVFTGAEEQPGIIVRVGRDPAAEICREATASAYHLLVLGLRGSSRTNGAMGSTCRAVLDACGVPLLITPPVLQHGMTAQVLFVADRATPLGDTEDWLAAQCQAQQLNAILCARTAGDAAPLRDLLASRNVRSQLFLCPELTSQQISSLAKDRRVRWLMLPAERRHTGAPARGFVHEVLEQATYPVLTLPAAEAQAS